MRKWPARRPRCRAGTSWAGASATRYAEAQRVHTLFCTFRSRFSQLLSGTNEEAKGASSGAAKGPSPQAAKQRGGKGKKR